MSTPTRHEDRLSQRWNSLSRATDIPPRVSSTLADMAHTPAPSRLMPLWLRIRGMNQRARIGVLAIAVLLVATMVGFAFGSETPTSRPLPGAGGQRSGDSLSSGAGSGTGKDAGAANGPAGSTASGGGTDDTGVSTKGRDDGDLVVAVECYVKFPGIVRVRDGARIADAVDLAGGLSESGSWNGLNRAQRVLDGQQICVGTDDQPGTVTSDATSGAHGSRGTAGSGAGAGAGGLGDAGGGAGTLINLNTASQSELETISGVGPKTAAAIIAYRQQIGRFTSVEQLGEVKGIGPAKLAAIIPQVTV